MKTMDRTFRVLLPLLAVAVIAVGPLAYARGTIATAWTNWYDGGAGEGPASESLNIMVTRTGKNCQLCHGSSSGGGNWNPYGWAMKVKLDGGMTNVQAFQAIEADNSDGDPPQLPYLPNGWTNGLEIQYHGQPGWDFGDNDIYGKTGSIIGTATPPAGLTVTEVNPSILVPVRSTTWARLKRLYGR